MIELPDLVVVVVVMWDKLDKCLPWMKSIFAEYFY